MKLRIACLVIGFVSLAQLTVAQISTQTASALPRLVRFGGTLKDLNGSPLTGVVGITFALYSEKIGGAPLWLETQNATADSNGHYTVLLGSTKPDGLPAELFTSEQARWVGVQISGQAEQPRVLLVSAPYALKAGDAETIGGLPPSAFVLAAPLAISSPAGSNTAATVPPPAATDVTTTGGTLNYLPIFSGADTIIDSAVFQTGSGTTAKVGIDTTTPATQLDVNGAGTIRGTLSLPAVGNATAAAGKNSQGLNLVASSFSSTSSTALNQVFRWQAEPAANDTTSPSGTLNLQYGLGATTPSETGLKLSSKGIFTFATGQTFPGTGDGSVTSVATGLGLKGGTITKTGTLTIDTTVVPQLAVANTFTANQTVKGSLTATSGSNAIAGNSSSTSGHGVEGSATAVSGTTAGVFGMSQSPAGYGVYGEQLATTGTTAGVSGYTGSSAGYGVEGYAAANTGSTVGVYGAAASSSGYGVEGQSPYIGVYSSTPAGTAGTYGLYQSPSTTGSTARNICIADCEDFPLDVQLNVQAGVWADTNWNGDSNASDVYVPALLATADANMAGVFLNSSSETPALLAWGLGTGGGEISDVLRAGGAAGSCSLTGSGDAACTGTLKSVVATPGRAGPQRVETYSVQSAENWFEDAGTAQLVNGAARVNLESVFGQTVNTGVEYHVFLTPDGDCKGLYVSAKTASGFEVRELGGGASSIAFEYRIMAKRVGYENVRLKNVTGRFNQQEARNKNMRRPVRSSADPQLSPKMPTSPMLLFRAGLQPVAAQPK